MGFTLRPYQKESIEIMKSTKTGERKLIALPTGSGKGIILAALSAQVNSRILIVVPSKELREQNHDKIHAIDSTIDVGSVQATLDEVNSKIVIASRQSLTHPKSTRIKRMLEHGKFEYIIIDEVHQAVDQVNKIIKRVNKDAKIIGLTATPYNKDLRKIFTKIDYHKTIFEMIEQDYLIEPQAILIQSRTDLRHVKIVAGEFNQKELETAVNNNERNQLVVKAYIEYAKNRKSTLVFATGIDHGMALTKEFLFNNINARYIDSNTHPKEREQIINDFKKFKFPVLINIGVLTTGFDHPPTDCIMLARPTKSRILYEQIIGRGLRLSPETNKENCLIIDINDVVKNHDLMSLSNVFELKNIKSGETPKQARERIKKEDQEEKERQIVEEKRRQEEIVLKAQKIKLFSRDMQNRFTETKYDWFKIDNLTYALTYDIDKHYIFEQYEDNDYLINYCFQVSTEKGNKSIVYIASNINLVELIFYVENKLIKNRNTFVIKNSDWKNQQATENQRKYISWARTKWDAHKYFTSNTIKGLMKYAEYPNDISNNINIKETIK